MQTARNVAGGRIPVSRVSKVNKPKKTSIFLDMYLQEVDFLILLNGRVELKYFFFLPDWIFYKKKERKKEKLICWELLH